MQTLTTAQQFKEGDPVTINLGYNDSSILSGNATPVIPGNNKGLGTVFQGFVKRVGTGMPCEVECEGYVRPLRLGMSVTAHYKATKASVLLNLLTYAWTAGSGAKVPGSDSGLNTKGASTGIKVIVAHDMDLVNVTLNENNGVEIIEAVKRFSEGALNIFFINPTTLWCGLTYTPYQSGTDPFGLGRVNYRLGWNCPRNNDLKMRIPSERVHIILGGTLANAVRVKGSSDDATALRHEKKISNHVGTNGSAKVIAQELQLMKNYSGYQGSLTGFLHPWCQPGDIVNITDAQLPKLNGDYMCEGTEINFGLKGARIRVEVGPKLSFAS